MGASPNKIGFVEFALHNPLAILLLVVAVGAFSWVIFLLFSTRGAVRAAQPSLLFEQARKDVRASVGAQGAAAQKADEPQGRLGVALCDAGINVSPSVWAAGCAALVVIAVLIGLMAGGAVFSIVLTLIALVVPWIYVSMMSRKRLELLEEQLAQAELQIAEASRSGLPVERAILSTVNSCAEPLKSQFERVYNEISFGGLTLADALAGFAKRTANKDADLLAAVVAVQQESGASLASSLEFLHKTVIKRIEMRQTLRARIAETKLSAVVAGVAPIIMFAFCCVGIQGFYDFYVTQPLGWGLIVGFVVLTIAGVLILLKMSDVKMD